MTEQYIISGVTVTPRGGGVYELTHPSLPEPVMERGKEKADARAHALAAQLTRDDDTPLLQQGDLDATKFEGALVEEAGDDVVQLKQELEKMRAQLAALETQTVRVVEGTMPEGVPSGVPRRFTEELNPQARETLAALGVETVDIILEESPDIPPTGLFISHNHRSYVIVPGEKVTVPTFLTDVLSDAVMSTPVVDSKSQKVLGYRDRMKYPFRRV